MCARGHFQRNKTEAPIHIRRAYLMPLAKYWMALTHANVPPCSNVSDITAHRAIFLYCVLRGLNINIGQVIADEIQSCAHSASNKAPLGHPSLITHLCETASINVSQPPLKHPRKEIDASYYTQHYPLEEPGQPMQSPAQEPIHVAAPGLYTGPSRSC